MPTVRRESGSRAPLVPGVEPGTVGVMLGSPEHRIRRAIASYRAGPGWEVAKVAFGAEGRELLAGEAEVLSELAGRAPGVPACLGRVDGGDLHLLRLPRVRGRMLPAGHWEEAVTLLENWWVPGERVPASAFPEWPAIVEGLSGRDRRLLDRLSEFRLLPGVRHGDFARWNLIGSDDGGLTALDWEWGVARGMPGLDLVHFFAQDARLVHRQSPSEVIESTLSALRHPRCLALLGEAGWEDDVASVMLASLAHTFGSRQQDNGPVLEVLARRLESEPLSKTA